MRADRLRIAIARAELRAVALTRSLQCSGGESGQWPPRHRTDPDGCTNDGTSCLCECHDREDTDG